MGDDFWRCAAGEHVSGSHNTAIGYSAGHTASAPRFRVVDIERMTLTPVTWGRERIVVEARPGQLSAVHGPFPSEQSARVALRMLESTAGG